MIEEESSRIQLDNHIGDSYIDRNITIIENNGRNDNNDSIDYSIEISGHISFTINCMCLKRIVVTQMKILHLFLILYHTTLFPPKLLGFNIPIIPHILTSPSYF